MAIDDAGVTAVTGVLNALVSQLVDTNTALAEMSYHVTYLAMHSQKIVDELRTLNLSIGRLEDRAIYPPK